jgi:hypothetical protein
MSIGYGSATDWPTTMANLRVPYLATRTNRDGTVRYYFQPRSKDTKLGWSAVRLHDRTELPIVDVLVAAAACRAIVRIYAAWQAGEPGAGPHRIDRLGRVAPIALASQKVARDRRYLPGQIGAMVADYLRDEVFLQLSAKTQKEYRIYLGLFVDKFGTVYWHRLAPGNARKWLMERAAVSGAAGAHALYRTVRAFFGKVRLCYDDVDHPGFVNQDRNPFASLDLSLPKASVIVWPRGAVDAFVSLADALGQPSMGDAIVVMSWLGVRRQDWLAWPATVFDRELVTFAQEKTDKALVLPWGVVPALAARVSAAKARRAADAVSASTFFHDRYGRPWRNAGAFRTAFNALRQQLMVKHPFFPTRYYVGIDPNDPLRLPTAMLTMRTMRHTCVTLNHDAGVPRELISAITGHEPANIDAVLAHYTARTADQAAAALSMRVAHEAKGT